MRHLSGGLVDHHHHHKAAGAYGRAGPMGGRHASGDLQQQQLMASSPAELPGYRAAGRHASGDSHLQVQRGRGRGRLIYISYGTG